MTLLAAVIVVVAATTLFTLSIRPKDLPKADPVSPTHHLEERKARIYENLRDLQFEYRVGKLSDVDYQRTKLSLQQELAVVLSEIDQAILPAGSKQQAVAKAAIAPSPAPAAASAVVCSNCGAKFSTAMKFCGECGKAIA